MNDALWRTIHKKPKQQGKFNFLSAHYFKIPGMKPKLLLSLVIVISAFVVGERIVPTNARVTPPPKRSVSECPSRKQLGAEAQFWAQDESSEPSDFIFFDREKWEFSVCLDGKLLTAPLEKPEATEMEYTEVGVSEKLADQDGNSSAPAPYLEDLNGDGKVEFIGQVGQCVEGPCDGVSYVFQIDGNQITLLGLIDAWGVTPVTEKGRHALLVSHQCFDYDFAIEFSYLSIVEFTSNGLLAVPHERIRDRYPATLRSNLKNVSPWEKLINDAYNGTDIRTLEESYASLVIQNPEIANVHCDPLEIIRSIAGESPATLQPGQPSL